MFADAVAKLSASIFPIFFAFERDGGPAVSVSATGFFVDDSGLFVTADHIMNSAPAGSTYYYYGNLPDQLRQPAVEIERVASDPRRDLYLGRVGRNYMRAVELSGETVRPGDSVCLSGYPMAEVSINADRGVLANVRRYWQPTFVIDVTQAVVGSRVYDGYLVGHPCLAGMSGGPVFDVEGKVRGMAVATFNRSTPELGELSIVKNGIVLDVEHIRAFVERENSK
ncbi:MAG TPA: serine protease [Terriglobia bacterium]|nr:serine protease [Terriglobia bacterium]